MRLRAALIAAAAALLLLAGGGCGSGDDEDITGYTYSVSGGVAGIDRRLVVTEDSVSVSERGSEPLPVAIEPRLLTAARDALEAAPLSEIAERSPVPDDPVPDDIAYTVTAGGTTVTGSQAAGVDPDLQPVIDALDPVLVAAIDQINPERE